LANSKSALKRWRQSLADRDRNRSIKSRTRTALGKALAAIQDVASTAEEAVRTAVSELDKAAQAGVIHDNAAARGKSRLLKRYNLAVANKVISAAAATTEQPEEKPKTTRRASSAAKPAKPAAKPRGRTTKK
jgi:small subunit ribosomal protein S20